MRGTFILLFIIFFSNIFAQSPIVIGDGQDVKSIGKEVFLYKDSTQSFDIEIVSNNSFAQYFQISTQEIPNFDITSHAVWAKFVLKNESQERLFLEIDNPNIDSISLFYSIGNQTIKRFPLTGAAFPVSSKNLFMTNFVFALPMEKGEVGTFYLRLKGTFWLNFPLYVGTPQVIFPSINQKNILVIFYIGIMFSMLLYNIFILFLIRERQYFYYVLYVLCFLLLIFHGGGFSYFVFHSFRPYLDLYILLLLFSIFFKLFSNRFLKLKQYSRFLYRIFQILVGIDLLMLLLYLIGYEYITKYFNNLFLSLGSMFCWFSAVFIYWKGYLPARFYLIATVFPFIPKVILMLMRWNILHFEEEIYHLFPAGEPIQMLLLSFALAYQIKILTQKNEKIQHENYALIKNQRQELEQKVKERTHQLLEKNNEVEAQNEELIQQKESLTELNHILEKRNSELIAQKKFIEYQKEKIELLMQNLEKKVAERTQELQLTIKDLSKQYQALEEFSYIISHNIRAPLARMMGLLNIYDRENPANSFNQDIINYLDMSSQELDGIIKDLTQVIYIRNNIGNSAEKVALDEIVRAVIASVQQEIEKVEAKFYIDFSVINHLQTVKGYTQSIMYHLISNALKFRDICKPLEIKISTYLAEKEGNKFVCLCVQDNGIGIDLTYIEPYKIFGLYQRMHTHVEGKGLGLFWVKTQIEALNGKVEVESKKDEGSIFRVYFPL
ncbi:MAG: ATP-binding protein [Thermoflexibacter sp.]|jgi:signal transduction histidine kinase|nr:ATP-binding protein [Thermoflexibacter sp.]